MQKTINQGNFHCFTDFSPTSFRLICSLELRRPLIFFLVSDRKRQNRHHLSLIDENQSSTLIGANYLMMNIFQSLKKNHIQLSRLLTLNSSLFVASLPVFCCLQATLVPEGFIHLVTISISTYFCVFK